MVRVSIYCQRVISACIPLYAHMCTQISIPCMFIWSDPVTECLNGSFSTWEQWWWIPSHDRVIAQGCFSINSPQKTPFTWHEHVAGHTQSLFFILPALLPSSHISSCPQIRWNFKIIFLTSISHCQIQSETFTTVNNPNQCSAEQQPLTRSVLSEFIVSSLFLKCKGL